MNVLNGFNGIAKIYDGLARLVFGLNIKRAQMYFLHEIPPNAKVLILGGGTGWILNEIVKLNPKTEIWYVEASSTMIDLSRRKAGTPGCIHFIHGTHNDIDFQIHYDVIITSFFLDLFTYKELRALIKKLSGTLHPSSIWLATDFVNANRRWQKALLKIMYWFFQAFANIRAGGLPRWEAALTVEGLKPVSAQAFYYGFIKSVMFRPALFKQ